MFHTISINPGSSLHYDGVPRALAEAILIAQGRRAPIASLLVVCLLLMYLNYTRHGLCGQCSLCYSVICVYSLYAWLSLSPLFYALLSHERISYNPPSAALQFFLLFFYSYCSIQAQFYLGALLQCIALSLAKRLMYINREKHGTRIKFFRTKINYYMLGYFIVIIILLK